MNGNTLINSPTDLTTTHEATRSGFIEIALERNRKGSHFIREARYIRSMARNVATPRDLLGIPDFENCLLTASGISDKASQYFNPQDKQTAILDFIESFLEPAGPDFGDELTFRYLLTRGDSLGGIMRNLAGKMGEEKFTGYLLAALRVNQINYVVWYKMSNRYIRNNSGLAGTPNAENVKAVHWTIRGQNRLLIYNTKIPAVRKNIDLSLIETTPTTVDKKIIIDTVEVMDRNPSSILAFGELKGGIDPAGADEHWKTANTALTRIRAAYQHNNHVPHTFLAAAAIETDMATEIFDQLQNNVLSKAANLTNEDQMNSLVGWLIRL
ncbi:MAG: AvaI/BsoBI family type II restriction endonuclease [Acidithiobacillus sp.]